MCVEGGEAVGRGGEEGGASGRGFKGVADGGGGGEVKKAAAVERDVACGRGLA